MSNLSPCYGRKVPDNKLLNQMNRSDLCSYLIHWTKGRDFDDAFDSLVSICKDGYLIGGNRGIVDNSHCVCFTETPAKIFHENEIGEFKPFGVMVNQKWLFEQGGRPVIYQPRYDIYNLDPSIRWKHVDFSLTDNEWRRNYKWQREWRIKTNQLRLTQDDEIQIFVPTESYARDLLIELEKYGFWICSDEQQEEQVFFMCNPSTKLDFEINILGIYSEF